MTTLAGIDIAAPPTVVLPIFLALLLAVAFLIARNISRLASRWLARGAAPSTLAPEEMPRLSVPLASALIIGGLLLIMPEMRVPARTLRWLASVLDIAFVLACALVFTRVAVAAVTVYAARNPSVRPALGVARVAVRLAVGILAVIMALQSLGVPVAPLLTTLGVGSLAVALALQETLANFFAGLYLLADRPVRTGDYIKIGDGEEGYVEAIGWRSSRLRTQRNNSVIVPNQKLSQAILTNFHLPSPPITTIIPVTISYDANADAADAALTDELRLAAAEIREIQPPEHGGAGAPAVRLVELGEAGMVFHCVFNVRDIEAQGRAGHELRKRIVARLHREKMEIAREPQRARARTASTPS